MSVAFKTRVHHNPSSIKLCNYLYRDKQGNIRALAQDFSPLVKFQANEGSHTWAKEFDNWRDEFEKNSDRTLYHFMLSPSPEDNATLAQLRCVAMEWATQNFANAMWTITYHNDNANHILHAHIVVNSVTLDGSKLQFDKQQWADLPNTANAIGKKWGLDKRKFDEVLTPFERYREREFDKFMYEEEIKRHSEKPFSDNERNAKTYRAKFTTHKDKIRNAINFAERHSKNWREFEVHMHSAGIDPRQNPQGGITYYFVEPVIINKRKIFNFAVKDKKLEFRDDEVQFSKEEIIKHFNFNANDINFENKLNSEKINAVELDFAMRSNFINVREQDSRFTKNGILPKLDKQELEKQLVHGKQTKASVKQTMQNVDAIMGALHVAHELNAETQQELQVEVDKAAARVTNIKNVIADKQYEKVMVETALDYYMQYNYPLNVEKKYEAQYWLENHKFGLEKMSYYSDRNLYAGQAIQKLEQQKEQLEKEYTNISNAYGTIDTILNSKYKHCETRSPSSLNINAAANFETRDYSKIRAGRLITSFVVMQENKNRQRTALNYAGLAMRDYKRIKKELEEEQKPQIKQDKTQQHQQQQTLNQQNQNAELQTKPKKIDLSAAKMTHEEAQNWADEQNKNLENDNNNYQSHYHRR